MPYWKPAVLIVALVFAGWVLTMYVLSALARRPDNLGVKEGRLTPCPSSPNCVCSQDDDADHAVEPIAFTGDADEAWARLKRVLADRPRTKVVSETENYLHAECTSLIFRFVD